MNDTQLLRYSRQIMLPEIGIEGQMELNQACVLVVGLGGLGSSVSYYLAAAGVGHLLLNDFDTVDFSNLQRQIVHNESRVGINKAESAKQTLLALNSEIQIDCYTQQQDQNGFLELVRQADVIVDASDNFTTRFLLNDISLESGKPLVSGAAIKHEGQISVFNQSKNSPCYRCLYSDETLEDDQTCVNNGVISPLVGIIGSIQANEVIKLIANIGTTLDGQLMCFDALNLHCKTLKLSKDPACRCQAS